jgi:hypothetical protein
MGSSTMPRGTFSQKIHCQDAPRIEGSAVVTTRLSSEAMNKAAEVTAKVHAVRLFAVMIVYMAFPATKAQAA